MTTGFSGLFDGLDCERTTWQLKWRGTTFGTSQQDCYWLEEMLEWTNMSIHEQHWQWSTVELVYRRSHLPTMILQFNLQSLTWHQYLGSEAANSYFQYIDELKTKDKLFTKYHVDIRTSRKERIISVVLVGNLHQRSLCVQDSDVFTNAVRTKVKALSQC